MLKRWVLIAVLLMASVRAGAVDYTDVYYNPAEEGWGVFLVQSDTFQFLAFFIYGPDGKPVWYTAELRQDSSGSFVGPLYATTGTPFGLSWNASDLTSVAVGTASFQPTSASTATLLYTLTGGSPVIKTLQRQTLTSITLAGNYVGGQSGAYSGCTSSAENKAYIDRYDLQVTQLNNQSVTLQFKYTNGLTCTFSGTLAQYGQLHIIPATTYQCSDGLNTTAIVSELKATSLGIEGRFAAPAVGGGCREDGQFSAVLQ